MKICMELSVPELLCIVNTIDDLHRELEKPVRKRFAGYKDRILDLDMQRHVMNRLSGKLSDMETLYLAHEEEKEVGDD